MRIVAVDVRTYNIDGTEHLSGKGIRIAAVHEGDRVAIIKHVVASAD